MINLIFNGIQSGGGGGYLKLYTFTIDHTQCGSSDSTNFPVLVSLSGTNLKTVANGGFIQNTVSIGGITFPADLVFSSDNAGASPYSWTPKFYDPVNGILVAYVKIPTVSHTTNTVFYMPYDNTAITTFQGGSFGSAFNANYIAVYPLPDGTTLSANDFTSNAHNGSVSNATATAGPIAGGGAAFARASSAFVSTGSVSLIDNLAAGGCTLWLNYSDYTANENIIIYQDNAGHSFNNFSLTWPQSSSGQMAVDIGGPTDYFTTKNDFALNTDYKIRWTWDSTNLLIYINGVLDSTHSVGHGTVSGGDPVTIGAYTISGGHGFFSNGKVQEVRFENTNFSADWETTEYNNQAVPGNIGSAGFYTVT